MFIVACLFIIFNLCIKAKIILMSATIDSSLFGNYFSQRLTQNIRLADGQTMRCAPAPIIKIETSTYSVQEFYWDDLTNPTTNSAVGLYLEETYRQKYDRTKSRHGFVDADSLLEYKKNFNYPNRYSDTFKRTSCDVNYAISHLTNQMCSMRFNLEEPVFSNEAMLMTIALLKYFDQIDNDTLKSSKDYVENDLDESDAEDGKTNEALIFFLIILN